MPDDECADRVTLPCSRISLYVEALDSEARVLNQTEIPMIPRTIFLSVAAMLCAGSAWAQDNFDSWPILKSTFPSTGGNGIIIKGYDPVISGGKCITTFMAVAPGPDPAVYPSLIEFDAVPTAGGTLCQNGKYKSFDGGSSGTTPYRVFFKNGVFYGSP
jgi:hypothetical protein